MFSTEIGLGLSFSSGPSTAVYTFIEAADAYADPDVTVTLPAEAPTLDDGAYAAAGATLTVAGGAYDVDVSGVEIEAGATATVAFPVTAGGAAVIVRLGVTSEVVEPTWSVAWAVDALYEGVTYDLDDVTLTISDAGNPAAAERSDYFERWQVDSAFFGNVSAGYTGVAGDAVRYRAWPLDDRFIGVPVLQTAELVVSAPLDLGEVAQDDATTFATLAVAHRPVAPLTNVAFGAALVDIGSDGAVSLADASAYGAMLSTQSVVLTGQWAAAGGPRSGAITLVGAQTFAVDFGYADQTVGSYGPGDAIVARGSDDVAVDYAIVAGAAVEITATFSGAERMLRATGGAAGEILSATISTGGRFRVCSTAQDVFELEVPSGWATANTVQIDASASDGGFLRLAAGIGSDGAAYAKIYDASGLAGEASITLDGTVSGDVTAVTFLGAAARTLATPLPASQLAFGGTFHVDDAAGARYAVMRADAPVRFWAASGGFAEADFATLAAVGPVATAAVADYTSAFTTAIGTPSVALQSAIDLTALVPSGHGVTLISGVGAMVGGEWRWTPADTSAATATFRVTGGRGLSRDTSAIDVTASDALDALTAGQWALLPSGAAGEAWVYLPPETAWPSPANLEYSVNGGGAQALGVTLPGAHLISGLTDGDAIRLRRVGTVTADWSDAKTFNEAVDGDNAVTILAEAPTSNVAAPASRTVYSAGASAAAAESAFEPLVYDPAAIDKAVTQTEAYQKQKNRLGLEVPITLGGGVQAGVDYTGRISVVPSPALKAADPLSDGVTETTLYLVTSTSGGTQEIYDGDLTTANAGNPTTQQSNWTAVGGTLPAPDEWHADGSLAGGYVEWELGALVAAGDTLTIGWTMEPTVAGAIKWILLEDGNFSNNVGGSDFLRNQGGTDLAFTQDYTAPAGGAAYRLRLQSSVSFNGVVKAISMTLPGTLTADTATPVTIRALPAMGLHTTMRRDVRHQGALFRLRDLAPVARDPLGRPAVVGANSIWDGAAWQEINPGDVVGNGAGRLCCVAAAGQILPVATTVVL